MGEKTSPGLGRALANLAGNATAALPGIIGSIVSWLLNSLGNTATWLEKNLWAMAIAVGTILLVTARDWLIPPKKTQSAIRPSAFPPVTRVVFLLHGPLPLFVAVVTHKSTVARTVMCRQDGRGRFPVLLDDLSKCRTNSQRKSQLS